MVESQALQLVLAAGRVSDAMTSYLSKKLKKMGYERVSPAMLNFLSKLECGVNYGSELARNIGVSRQMVAKTVKELCLAGYLDQAEGVGKQKEILFTKNGEQLMADARKLLADLDILLIEQMTDKSITDTVVSLSQIECILSELEK